MRRMAHWEWGECCIENGEPNSWLGDQCEILIIKNYKIIKNITFLNKLEQERLNFLNFIELTWLLGDFLTWRPPSMREIVHVNSLNLMSSERLAWEWMGLKFLHNMTRPLNLTLVCVCGSSTCNLIVKTMMKSLSDIIMVSLWTEEDLS